MLAVHLSMCSIQAADQVPAVVLCQGDDGLTARLCDEVERSLRNTRVFTLSPSNPGRMLKIRIPTNLDWDKVGSRTRALYKVQYSSADDTPLGEFSGSCWESRLNDCAKEIVHRARKYAERAR